MNIQQPERSHSGAPSNILGCSHGQHFAPTRCNHGPTRRIRRAARLLTLTAATVVIAVSAIGCSISGEPEAKADPPTETSSLATSGGEDHDLEQDDTQEDRSDREDLGANGSDGQQEQDEPPPLTPAPQELVGTWHNDPDGIDWYLTFTAEGTYALYSADLDVYDEGYVDTSDGLLHLITATGDTRPSQLVVSPHGCSWKVDAWELYGYAMTQLQLCDRAAWVMG